MIAYDIDKKQPKTAKKRIKTMIAYDIDKKQPKTAKKTILEAKTKLFLILLIAFILALAFYLIFSTEGV
ncbi:hypothetical protein [Helicobacter pylori]|uniref:hypothetical protein n=1 Tax=Helicobacter pylori TaxID=210 RepID=UPI003F912C4D